MAEQLSFSNKETYELIEQGEYEVILEKAELAKTKNGEKTYIALSFRIRNDVEQKFQNKLIFENIWKDKDNQNHYDDAKIQKILLTQGPNGKYEFANGYPELIQYINGLSMRITIEKKEADQWHEEPYNQVKYRSYKPSNAKPQELVSNQPLSQNLSNIEVNDDDLPF